MGRRIASPGMLLKAEPLPHLICSRPMLIGGSRMRRISMATRDELVAAIAERYSRADGMERGRILDEFTAVTGFHRKHAMRLLRAGRPHRRSDPRPGRRTYDDATRQP